MYYTDGFKILKFCVKGNLFDAYIELKFQEIYNFDKHRNDKEKIHISIHKKADLTYRI